MKKNRAKAIQIRKWQKQEAKRVAENTKRNTKRVTFDTIPEVLDEGCSEESEKQQEMIINPEPVQS